MLALVKSRGILPLGAEHTVTSGLPRSRESGFFISTCVSKPGSVLAIQDPPGVTGVQVPGADLL